VVPTHALYEPDGYITGQSDGGPIPGVLLLRYALPERIQYRPHIVIASNAYLFFAEISAAYGTILECPERHSIRPGILDVAILQSDTRSIPDCKIP
jgi:hypothetical protein